MKTIFILISIICLAAGCSTSAVKVKKDQRPYHHVGLLNDR